MRLGFVSFILLSFIAAHPFDMGEPPSRDGLAVATSGSVFQFSINSAQARVLASGIARGFSAGLRVCVSTIRVLYLTNDAAHRLSTDMDLLGQLTHGCAGLTSGQ
jgi:hypothetical protein